MAKIAVVTGADRGLGRGITLRLLEAGWTVFAGRVIDWPELDELAAQFPTSLHIVPMDVSSDASVARAVDLIGGKTDRVDLLVSNAGINRSAHIENIRAEQDFDDMIAEYNVNALGGLRMTRALLPLLDRSELKRLCYVSSEAGSIGASYRSGWYGYCMSKAATNMAVKNLSNALLQDGYSFRLYHPGWLRTYLRGVKNTEAHMEPEEAADFAVKFFLDDSLPPEPVLTDWEGNPMPW